ncbi:MAG: penicillin-binding protein 2 [Pseudomonadota bacterium]
MPRDLNRERIITRRALIIGGGQLALFTGLGARLYQLQVLEGDRYTMLAEDNRINLRLIAPLRGEITDRHGVPLASNRQAFRLVVVAEQTPNVRETLNALQGFLPIDERRIEDVLKEVGRKRAFTPVTVRENLSWDEVSKVEVNLPDLPGIQTEVAPVRYYPIGPAFAHVTGYVGAVSEAEQTGEPLLNLPSFKIGKNGLERAHEASLRGLAGTSQVEVNALGRVIRELARDEGEPGAEMGLTLDADLQMHTYKRLSQERSASAVIMDIHSGEVYALASQPGFDPNDFVHGISVPKWQGLLNDPAAPLTHKAIGGQYPPGSTFKMITVLAALEAGAITPEERITCRGHMQLGNHRFHCWKRGGHGPMDLADGLAQSCDVYYYELAMRIGIDRIADMARRFGLGMRTGIDVPGERPGLVPTTDWKFATLGERWQRGESLVASIGQGFMLTTPLQLAVMTARLANGGFAVTPTVVRRLGGEGNPVREAPAIDVSKRHLDIVLQAMSRVTNHPRGTAYRARIREDEMAMAGKTGTAQVKRISMADRLAGVKNEDLPWKFRHHALFVGYAPLDRPRYACAVVVDHGGGGSSTAAPIARDLLKAVQERRPADPNPGVITPLDQPI